MTEQLPSPQPLINLADYERAAHDQMSDSHYGYYAVGAADDISLKDNRNVFAGMRLRPRVLVGVETRDMQTQILGQTQSMPVLIAPTAMAGLASPAVKEIGIVQAARNAGITMILSTLSTTSLETVAAEGASLWFQLYIYKDRSITQRLVERAEAAGYQALVLTVDAIVSGLREQSVRDRFQLPEGLLLENFVEFQRDNTRAEATFFDYVRAQFNSALNWNDLEWLISITKLPVLIKGILRGDDARRALDYGAKGLILSNHGGRQLDTAITGIDALPDVLESVGGSCTILVDGGIRRGTDVLKALALGADAVLLGRPVLWGLAVDGQAGVEQVLSILRNEFDNALALCGCRHIADITRDLVVRT
ncbi:MAG TPA: alpha-hydroxy acid oxidase [Aggregatilineales bacterium]|nr:alpha-hydroxy acid oxidase [Aggregatilineales bacterium]